MKSCTIIKKLALQHLHLNAMIRLMNARRMLALTIFLICCSLVPLSAFQFSPLEQEFAPSGPDSMKMYTIVNDSDDSIAIQVSVLSRDLDQAGKEINTPASAYFSIVPNKIILGPRTTQIVRVQYRGPRTVPTELAFRLRAEQIPYTQGKAAENQSMFTFLYVYTTSLYVTPAQSIAQVTVEKAIPKLTKDGNQMMELTISNIGTVHQILNEARVEVVHVATKQSVIYEGEALGFVNGLNLLAGKKVVVDVEWPKTILFPVNPAEAQQLFTAKITYSR